MHMNKNGLFFKCYPYLTLDKIISIEINIRTFMKYCNNIMTFKINSKERLKKILLNAVLQILSTFEFPIS